MKELSCKKVLYWFEEINKIPRGSGNERAVSDFAVNFAKERGLLVHRDKANNVIIKKEGSHGLENAAPVCIQGHMDMVCEKEADVVHDFTKDPIKIIYEGDFIRADRTTLGADDGIAVAMAMALLDSDIPHPPLEAVFTTDEEVGMMGAAALDPGLISSRRLINIDSEQEGIFTVGCAGGCKTHSFIPVTHIKNSLPAYKISISGLTGGHSGIEIHRERGNANKLIFRTFTLLSKQFSDIMLADVNGGAKDNAIPRFAEMTVATAAAFDDICEQIKITEETYLNELKSKDRVKISIEKTTADTVFDHISTQNLTAFAALMPNGVQNNNFDLNMPDTSNNLGVVITHENEAEFVCALRSGTASLKAELRSRVEQLTALCGGRISVIGDYPAWEYKQNSALRDIMVSQFKALYGKEPVIETVHAGLECGLISEKMPDMDMVSIGPDIFDIHTPQERASISSIERVWQFLLQTLSVLK